MQFPEVTGLSPMDAALRYAEYGISVFPCNPATKAPVVSNGFHGATLDTDVISSWWDRMPHAAIGAPTGSPNKFFVLDVDFKHGKNAEIAYETLKARIPDLESHAAIAVTPTQGLHLFFLDQPELELPTSHGQLGDHLDFQANGAYVLLAPSKTPTGTYTWQKLPRTLSDAPVELLESLAVPVHRGRSFERETALKGAVEGSRNEQAHSYASSCRARGIPYTEAVILVRAMADECSPPLPHSEADRCTKSAYQHYAPGSQLYPLTELGNAERFAHRYNGKVIYIPELDRWMTRHRLVWRVMSESARFQKATDVIRSIPEELQEDSEEDVVSTYKKYSRKSESLASIRSLIELAAKQPDIERSAETLDTDPYLLGTRGAVIDLRTQLPTKSVKSYVSRIAHVHYTKDAHAPRWIKFIRDCAAEDEDLARFLQQVVGYSLIGDNRDQVLMLLQGEGSNGKSVFLNTVRSLLGDYGIAVDSQLFIEKRFGTTAGPREDLVRLQAARMLAATELPEGQALDEALVKRMTGNDPIVARLPFGKRSITFVPHFLPFLSCNQVPTVKGDGYAIWRRIRLLPFNAQINIDRQDRQLQEKLRAEFPGILNWALRGTASYLSEGLQVPKSVEVATKSYRDDMDLIAEWLEEETIKDLNGWTDSTALMNNYVLWCQRASVRPLHRNTFLNKLTTRGYLKSKHKGTRGRRGIRLKDRELRVVT